MHLKNLKDFTKYFYRVRTRGAISDVFEFKTLSGVEIKIQPYIQDASPHSVFILWETEANNYESVVEWGTTKDLGNTSKGVSYPSSKDAKVHQVHLKNLKRFTRYFYRVSTKDIVSDIFRF